MTALPTLNRENFRKLIQSTEEAKPETFCMDVFAWLGVHESGLSSKWAKFDCGTPACVLGNYAARQDLQTAFYINADYGSVVARNEEGLQRHMSYDSPIIAEHFGITRADCETLFAAPNDEDIDPDDADYDEDGDEYQTRRTPGGCGDAKTPAEAVAFLKRFVADRIAQEARSAATVAQDEAMQAAGADEGFEAET